MYEEGKVVKRGTFLYADNIICDVCIQQTNCRYGAGDIEDPPEYQEDVYGEWFYTDSNSNLRSTACLPFGKTGSFFTSCSAVLNWKPYYIWYSPAGDREHFISGGGCCATLDEAMDTVAKNVAGLCWLT